MKHGSTFVDQQMLNIDATYWNIVILVEYSFNFGWSTITHFGATAEEMLLSLCVSSVVVFKVTGNSQLMESRNHGDSRKHGKLAPELASIY